MTLNTQPLIFKRPRSSGPSLSPQTPSVSLSWEDTTSAPLERVDAGIYTWVDLQ